MNRKDQALKDQALKDQALKDQAARSSVMSTWVFILSEVLIFGCNSEIFTGKSGNTCRVMHVSIELSSIPL